MPKRIPTHRAPGARHSAEAYEHTPERMADARFYASTRWRRLRVSFLAEHPLCEDCRKAGRLTSAAHVHHVLERKDRPDLALDPSNLEALCPPCHNAKRRAQPA